MNHIGDNDDESGSYYNDNYHHKGDVDDDSDTDHDNDNNDEEVLKWVGGIADED